MPLSTAQLRVSHSSKCVLFGSIMLMLYSIAVLVTVHHHGGWHHDHHHDEHDHHHHHGPRRHGDWSQSKPEKEFAHMIAGGDAMEKPPQRGAVSVGSGMQPGKPMSGEDQMRGMQPGKPDDHQIRGRPFMHGDEDHHDHHHHHGRPRMMMPPQEVVAITHFAVLGLITSLTGIISAFVEKRGWALAFLILILVTECVALGLIGHKNARAVHMCKAHATHPAELVEVDEAVFKNKQTGAELHVASARVVAEGEMIDGPELFDCVKHVRHAVVIACGIVGVIATALACCASSYSAALAHREMEEKENQAIAAAVADAVVGSDNKTDNSCVDMDPVVVAIVLDENAQNIKEDPVVPM